ncbi:hypothetical protein CJD50_22920 [Hafnia paralvei]|uniref:Uncharacterized protein n=2 Tax=Hafnia paralvei TaxID=546367 RepID=A0A2A2M6F5_9GAMM|nr:hypothetical protein CJD50_22920 [Hafnia paralvei]
MRNNLQPKNSLDNSATNSNFFILFSCEFVFSSLLLLCIINEAPRVSIGELVRVIFVLLERDITSIPNGSAHHRIFGIAGACQL